MNEFMIWEVLLTYGGCVAATVLVTEWLKKLLPKLAAQLISFVIALLIMFIGNLAMGSFAFGDIPLYLVNAVGVSLAANGGFDALKGLFGVKKEEAAKPAENQMVVGNGTEGNTAYFTFEKDPSEYKDGDVITFTVHKENG